MGTFYKEVLLFCSYEAFLPFRLCSSCAVGFSPCGNSFGCFATGPSASSLSRSSGGQESRWGVRYAPGFFVPGGFLPSHWIPVQREGWECFWTIVCCARAHSRFANSFGSWRRVSCSFAAVFFFYARYTPRLTFTIPRHTFDDVGNGGGLRRIATAFFFLSWFPIFGSWCAGG